MSQKVLTTTNKIDLNLQLPSDRCAQS